MKKVLLIIIILFNLSSKGQTFIIEFQKTHDAVINGNHSFRCNIDQQLFYYVGVILQADLLVYEKTKETKYLNEIAILSKRIIDRRDDNLFNANPLKNVPANVDIGDTICSVSTNFQNSFLGSTSKGWSAFNANNNKCYLTQYFKETAEILTPMANFAYLIKSGSVAIQNQPLPVEVGNIYLNGNLVINFLDYANWLVDQTNQSITFHDNEYNSIQSDGINDFQYVQRNSYNNTGGINQQLFMGKLLAIMYQISILDNNPNIAYVTKVKRMAKLFKNHLDANSSSTPNLYTWCHVFDCDIDGNLFVEDIGHALIDIEFVEACYKYGIPTVDNYYFTLGDMQRFARNFTDKIISNPLQIHKNVFGTNVHCDQLCTSGQPPEYYGYITGVYTFLAQYEPDVYQIVSDFYSPDNINNYNVGNNLDCIVGFAQLALYQHVFNPLTVNRNTWPSSNWAGCASGTFANGQSNTFATLRNMDGAVEIYSIDNSNAFTPKASIINHSQGWGGITAKDFDGDGIDEIVALHHIDNAIYVYKQQSTSLLQIAALPLTGNQYIGISAGTINGTALAMAISNLGYVSTVTFNNGNYIISTSSFIPVQMASGIAIGNFDNTGNNKIATINNSNGYVEIWDYNIATHSFTNAYQFTAAAGTNNQWNGICAGDFDGDGQDEIIAHRDYDGDFFIYKVKGGALVNDEKECFPTNQLNGIMCSINLPDLAPNKSLLTLRNFDGNMVVYSMEGHCPNLQLSNQTIDEAFSLDNQYTNVINNYPIDYHVNNTITAGNNYAIVAPANVNFTAGNKIILKPGFSAKAGSIFKASIDPAIACVNPLLRTSKSNSNGKDINTSLAGIIKPAQQWQQTKVASTQPGNSKIINHWPAINIYPNPMQNTFNVAVYSDILEEATVSIYNTLGIKVKSINSITILQQGLNEHQINTGNLASGQYNFEIKTATQVINKKIIIQ